MSPVCFVTEVLSTLTSSIQRRWGSLDKLLLETVLSYSQQMLPIPDTGSLRGDLIAFGRLMDGYLKSPLGDTVARTMAAVEDDAALAANRAKVIRIRYGASRQMAERAAKRGELRAGIDPQMPVELVVAPVYLRKLITRQPVDDKFIEQVVDAVLGGVLR
jgi:hypothetical protein